MDSHTASAPEVLHVHSVNPSITVPVLLIRLEYEDLRTLIVVEWSTFKNTGYAGGLIENIIL